MGLSMSIKLSLYWITPMWGNQLARSLCRVPVIMCDKMVLVYDGFENALHKTYLTRLWWLLWWQHIGCLGKALSGRVSVSIPCQVLRAKQHHGNLHIKWSFLDLTQSSHVSSLHHLTLSVWKGPGSLESKKIEKCLAVKKFLSIKKSRWKIAAQEEILHDMVAGNDGTLRLQH